MKYFVNEFKGIVACVIEPNTETDEFQSFLDKRYGSLLGYQLYGMLAKKDLIPTDKTFRGKSKCNPMDEWDEERGKTIARARALAKYHSAWIRALDEIYAFLDKLVALTDACLDKRYDKLEAIEDEEYYAMGGDEHVISNDL